ncbi:hypothetical protein G6F54_013852 [Rhizopus delemar]|nr:hypothetical protein G6F54_013852 [Rhizopus delemar]
MRCCSASTFTLSRAETRCAWASGARETRPARASSGQPREIRTETGIDGTVCETGRQSSGAAKVGASRTFGPSSLPVNIGLFTTKGWTMEPILLGKGITDDIAVTLLPKLGNRHGLVAGATGTGKTVTLQVLAESFSRIGTPVFMADVKGDLTAWAWPNRPGAPAR